MSELVEVRNIETVTAEIVEAKQVGGEAILTIGKGLIEAKGMLDEGKWLAWLGSDEIAFSIRTAQRFMRLANEWTDATALSRLGATKALTLLALPESEREDFIAQTHEVGGEEKTVVDMTTRELEQAIRERDEARKEAENAERHLSGALERLKEAQEKSFKSGKQVLGLQKELDALKAKPVEVAVQEDEGAKRRIAELEEQLKRAQAEKPSPFAGDDSLIQFNVLFDQAQEAVNRMRGLLLKVRNNDADAAERLGKALEALAELVRGAAA